MKNLLANASILVLILLLIAFYLASYGSSAFYGTQNALADIEMHSKHQVGSHRHYDIGNSVFTLRGTLNGNLGFIEGGFGSTPPLFLF